MTWLVARLAAALAAGGTGAGAIGSSSPGVGSSGAGIPGSGRSDAGDTFVLSGVDTRGGLVSQGAVGKGVIEVGMDMISQSGRYEVGDWDKSSRQGRGERGRLMPPSSFLSSSTVLRSIFSWSFWHAD